MSGYNNKLIVVPLH